VSVHLAVPVTDSVYFAPRFMSLHQCRVVSSASVGLHFISAHFSHGKLLMQGHLISEI